MFPLKLLKQVRLKKGPILLGRPLVGPNGIYVGGGSYPVFRLDAESLSVVWSKEYLSCTPGAVVDQQLIIGNGANQLRVLASESGEEMWSWPSPGGTLWRGNVLAYESGRICLLDLRSGSLRSHFDFPGTSVRDVRGDLLLYAKEDGHDGIGVYDLAERRCRWEKLLLVEITNRSGVTENSINLVLGEQTAILTQRDTAVFACALGNGEILWHHHAFVPPDVAFAHRGRVYLLTRGLPMRNQFAKFICIDEVTGEKLYETSHEELLAYRPSSPAVHDGHVFFGSTGGFVFAFRLADGELIWRHRTNGEASQPTARNDRLHVTNDNGEVFVFA